MPIDPRQLRPTELVRLLNSTPLGEVIGERQLLRHRSRAGFRIGDDRHVDLFRYVAWLVHVRHEPQPETDGEPYGAMKERRGPATPHCRWPDATSATCQMSSTPSGRGGLPWIFGSSVSPTSRSRSTWPGRPTT